MNMQLCCSYYACKINIRANCSLYLSLIMKLYFKISKLQFYVILFLILLIPVSKKYRLLIFGVRTEGIAVGYGEGDVRTYVPDYTIFRFQTEKGSFDIQGPENVIYKPGEKARIIYSKKNPEKCMILSFAYLYSSPNALVPGFILLLWIAFYASFTKSESRHKTIRKSSS
jgi:hypothetical protein